MIRIDSFIHLSWVEKRKNTKLLEISHIYHICIQFHCRCLRFLSATHVIHCLPIQWNDLNECKNQMEKELKKVANVSNLTICDLRCSVQCAMCILCLALFLSHFIQPNGVKFEIGVGLVGH